MATDKYLSVVQTIVLDILKRDGGWMTINDMSIERGHVVQWKTLQALHRKGMIDRVTNPPAPAAYRYIKPE